MSRAEWKAKPPAKPPVSIDTPTPELWLHHTAGNERGPAGMRAIQAFHMRPTSQGGRGWSDIAYSLVVDPDDLTIYEGRGIGVAGGHTKGRNSFSHAICVMGNFDNQHPSPGLLRLLADLVRHGRSRWWVDLTGGHRQAPGASTACPGRHLYAAIGEIRTLSNATLPEDDDMTPDQAATLDAVAKQLKDLPTLIRREIDDTLVDRGLVAATDDKKGGAVGEIRRNIREIAKAAGVPADHIET